MADKSVIELENHLHQQYAENDNNRSAVLLNFLIGIIALFGFYGLVFVNANETNTLNINMVTFLLMSGVTIGILFFLALLTLFLGNSIRRDHIIVHKIRLKRFKENKMIKLFGKLYSPYNKTIWDFIPNLYNYFYWLFFASELLVISTTIYKIHEVSFNYCKCFMCSVVILEIFLIVKTFCLRKKFFKKYEENCRKIGT